MDNIIKIGVGLYIFNNLGQVLLGLRQSKHGYQTWCPPGGHMEYGESNEQAAVREAEEETGLKISPDNVVLKGVTNDFYKESGKHYITLHLYCNYYQGTPQVKEPHKCLCWKWFDLNNLPEPLMLSNQNFFKQIGII